MAKKDKTYILIADGIYEVKMKKDIADDPVDCENIPNYKHIPNYAYWLKDFPYNKVSKEVIREGNSIEELCDVFIVKYNSFKPIIHDTLEEIEYLNEMVKNKEYTIYGAVWFDTGLYFVTKMNNKGKFKPMKWYQEFE